MRSARVCLVTGQETQLISKQEVKIAEKALLLSTQNLWIVFTLAQGQSGVEILKNSGDKQEVGAWTKTLALLLSPQLFWDGVTLQHVRKYNLVLLLLGHNRQHCTSVWVWTGVGDQIQHTGNCYLRDLEHNGVFRPLWCHWSFPLKLLKMCAAFIAATKSLFSDVFNINQRVIVYLPPTN